MSEYTPRTHEIRAAAVNHRAPLIHRQMLGQTIRDAERVALVEFDRWLAEYTAERERAAAEKAWVEGAHAQWRLGQSRLVSEIPVNPYRRNEGENE